jgi:integrase/recombinase XerD
MALIRFIVWCDARGLNIPSVITRPVLESYQRFLYGYRQHSGEPLSVVAQLSQMTAIKAWFKWLARQNHILSNPAADLILPPKPRALPKSILSVTDIDRILAQCDVTTVLGIRNRAILETLYSSGLRRLELIQLKLHDVNLAQGTIHVRQGKGNKDRLVPLGARASLWVEKYLQDARPQLLTGIESHVLFLHDDGRPMKAGRLGDLVKRHLEHAGIGGVGACHRFRHAMATHMLENGADIRYIQVMLGHADLATTQIYTHVSLDKLKSIHVATHPAKLPTESRPDKQDAPNNEARPVSMDWIGS